MSKAAAVLRTGVLRMTSPSLSLRCGVVAHSKPSLWAGDLKLSGDRSLPFLLFFAATSPTGLGNGVVVKRFRLEISFSVILAFSYLASSSKT